MRHTERAERSRTQPYQQPQPLQAFHGTLYQRGQVFHHSHTSLGAAGHIVHMGMVAAPLLIGEFIHDSEQRWRAMRFVPVIGALASEALWTIKIAHDRNREKEDHAALTECRERCR